MIVSKPKFGTSFSLGIFLLVILVVFFFLFDGLLRNSDYFWVKLILAPVLLAIGLVVFGKFLAGMKQVTLGDGKIEVLYLVSRQKIRLHVKDVLGWREEAVKTKNGDFREVKILYGKNKILKLSNKESTDYDKVVKYLKQKVKV